MSIFRVQATPPDGMDRKPKREVIPYPFLNFSWLTTQQIATLDLVLEHLSEQYGEVIAGARENLAKY